MFSICPFFPLICSFLKLFHNGLIKEYLGLILSLFTSYFIFYLFYVMYRFCLHASVYCVHAFVFPGAGFMDSF